MYKYAWHTILSRPHERKVNHKDQTINETDMKNVLPVVLTPGATSVEPMSGAAFERLAIMHSCCVSRFLF